MFKKAILKGFVSWVAASTLKEKLVFLKQHEFGVNTQIILVAKNTRDPCYVNLTSKQLFSIELKKKQLTQNITFCYNILS